MPLIDLRCHACGHGYGYRGEPRDCPPCPRCKVPPERKDMGHDQEVMDEFRSFLRDWKERKTLARPGRVRMAAGLSLRQAAKLLDCDPTSLAEVEHGSAALTPELAAKMADAYGVS
jgi:ribosome-binding protein aMBF1 (putative translation factor)